MNGKCIRTTILTALALAGGAQASTNAVLSLDTEEYRKKALGLIRRADVPSLQVTMTSPNGVLSFCVVNDTFYAAPGRQQKSRPIDGKFRFHGGNNVAYKGMAIMIPERNITLCYFFNGDTRYNLHGPLTDLFLKPNKRLYAHTGGVPLPAPPLGTGPTNLGASPLKPWGLSPSQALNPGACPRTQILGINLESCPRQALGRGPTQILTKPWGLSPWIVPMDPFESSATVPQSLRGLSS